MSRKPALDTTQLAELRRWYQSGCSVDSAFERAIKAGWKVSRATIGKERGPALDGPRVAAPAAQLVAPSTTSPPTLASLAAEIIELRRRLDAMASPQGGGARVPLRDALSRAVMVVINQIEAPDLDPRSRAELVKSLKSLADAIRQTNDLYQDDMTPIGDETPEDVAERIANRR